MDIRVGWQLASLDRSVVALYNPLDLSKMAPVAEDVELNGLLSKKKDEIENKENLWSAILGEVQTRGSTKLPSCKSVVVLVGHIVDEYWRNLLVRAV
ncbi:unnamed protein product [Timema podura]|uniref:Uncharacterized protein n=1 Tax=Timema podura TaxID=61482 RepID=A0ABN7PIC9_TIMPD|nr:unnamed protein product [Timema podura]